MTRRARLSEAESQARRSSQHAAVPPRGPLRTCVGCRERDLRSVLLRVVLDAAGPQLAALVVDPGRRRPGRGAWLHPDVQCLDRAERRRAFPRALRYAGAVDSAAVRRYVEAIGSGTEPGSSDRRHGSGFDADGHPMSTQR